MPTTDKSTVNIVVLIVGLAALACIGGVIGLAASGTAVPAVLQTTTGTALGGLLALLVSTRTNAVDAGQVVPLEPVDGDVDQPKVA